MLTPQDFKQIKNIIDVELETKLEEKLEQKFNEKIGLLPTKEEFFNSMDQVMTELKAIRQEQVVNTHRINDHEERIVKLEENIGFQAV